VTCYFFDTAALQHRYVDGPYSKRVRRIISDRRWDSFIADVTILEIASALARKCRKRNWNRRKYDALDMEFWKDVADRRLRIRETTQRDILRARHLIRFAGVVGRREMGSADALIGACCLDLALERRERVAFYTSDWTLYTILRDLDAFRSTLVLRYVGQGKAGIPTETG